MLENIGTERASWTHSTIRAIACLRLSFMTSLPCMPLSSPHVPLGSKGVCAPPNVAKLQQDFPTYLGAQRVRAAGAHALSPMEGRHAA
jgi:hypothetical protein